jgi:hypothetical protein
MCFAKLLLDMVQQQSNILFTYFFLFSVALSLSLSFSLLGLQRGVYDNLFHAIAKICKEEGHCALYRGLCPSLIGVMPYAAINYFAYDSMRKMYKTTTKKQEIGHLQTMLMGSIAGVLSSTVTFPLEVARRRMQVPNLPMSPPISVQQAFFRPNPTIDFKVDDFFFFCCCCCKQKLSSFAF